LVRDSTQIIDRLGKKGGRHGGDSPVGNLTKEQLVQELENAGDAE